MSDTEWRDGLKAGDEIAMRAGYGYAQWELGRIVRRDKVKIVVQGNNGGREEIYSAKHGSLMGGDTWSRRRLEPVTDKIRADVRRRKLLHRLKDCQWDKRDDEALTAIVALLDAHDARIASTEDAKR